MRLLFATAFVFAFPLGAAADHSETAFVSTGPAGGSGALDASFRRTSQDGSRVFFVTRESPCEAP